MYFVIRFPGSHDIVVDILNIWYCNFNHLHVFYLVFYLKIGQGEALINHRDTNDDIIQNLVIKITKSNFYYQSVSSIHCVYLDRRSYNNY